MIELLNVALEKSYLQHPYFDFKSAAMRVDPALLDKFDKHYGLVVASKGSFSVRQLAACRGACVGVLNEIFFLLAKQAVDKSEETFLNELRKHCEELMLAELQFHALPIRNRNFEFPNEKSMANAREMITNRFFFNRISKEAVREILSLGKGDLERFRWNAAARRVTRDDLSLNGGRVIKNIVDVLDVEFWKNGSLPAVSLYVGRKIHVIGLAFELSVPQASWWRNKVDQIPRPPETLYAHFDEAIWAPKSIVYLSDVTAENGPTSCYPGVYESLGLNRLQNIVGRTVFKVATSQASPLYGYYGAEYHQTVNSENFRKHFMRLPTELRFNSHFGWDVMPGSSIEQELVKLEKTMIGEAGTCIVFDGARLLHRGGLVRSGERIAMQVILGERKPLLKRAQEKIKRKLISRESKNGV
jgi:hypothetical protein